MDEFDELYQRVYELSKEHGYTVPLIFRPYDQNRKTINMEKWNASVEHKREDGRGYNGSGNTQEEALIDLMRNILEGENGNE